MLIVCLICAMSCTIWMDMDSRVLPLEIVTRLYLASWGVICKFVGKLFETMALP
jgi:hypothetical protein